MVSRQIAPFILGLKIWVYDETYLSQVDLFFIFILFYFFYLFILINHF